MSTITKYMQMNSQILLAYEYNKYQSLQRYLSTNTIGQITSNIDYRLSTHIPVVVHQSSEVVNVTGYGRVEKAKSPLIVDTYLNSSTASNSVSLSSYLEKDTKYNLGLTSTAFANSSMTEWYKTGYLDKYCVGTSLTQSKIYKSDYDSIFDALVSKQYSDSNNNYIYNFYSGQPWKEDRSHPVYFGLGAGNADGMIYDKIRVYIVSGYVFNFLEGFNLIVKAKQRALDYNVAGKNIVPNRDGYATLLSFAFDKSEMRSKVKWLSTPFYMASKYYDRYIDLYLPSPFYLGLLLHNMNTKKETDILEVANSYPEKKSDLSSIFLDQYGVPDTAGNGAAGANYVPAENSIEMLAAVLNVDVNTDIFIEFSPIVSDNYKVYEGESVFSGITWGSNSAMQHLEKEAAFYRENVAQAAIKQISNSDFFNAKVQQDPYTGIIYYSPRFGVADEKTGDIPLLNRDIMNRINSGLINMYNFGALEEDYEDIDEFESTYGNNASKWVVYNELIVTYYYKKFPVDLSEEPVKRTSVFNNSIDYSTAENTYANYDAANESELFGVTSYRPVIKPVQGYNCDSITIVYNAHLINRMNGAEVVRTASLALAGDDLNIYSSTPRKLNIDNLNTWKVFNKVSNNASSVLVPPTVVKKEYVRTYYTNNDLEVMANGNFYGQGGFVLGIFASGNRYKFSLYSLQDGQRVPYSMSNFGGTYILKFFLGNGGKLELTPTFSENMNLTLGELEFYISENNATKLLSNSGNTFVLVSKAANNEETTLYQGTYSSY